MGAPRGTAEKRPASSGHDQDKMSQLQAFEQNIISSATRPLAALFHKKVPGKRNSVLLDPMQFHNALFKGLASDPPLTQQLVMTLATSNDAAPMISVMMSHFAADATLMTALKAACSTWPSLGSSLIALANRIVAVLNAGAWIKGESQAINTLAGWVLHLYRKNQHGSFAKTSMSVEHSFQLCARLLLCIFEDLAYDGSCFKTVLSGDLAVPTQLDLRNKFERQYTFQFASGATPMPAIDLYEEESSNATTENLKVLTGSDVELSDSTAAPFTPDEQLAFHFAFKQEVIKFNDSGRFSFRTVASVLACRSVHDCIDHFKKNRHIYAATYEDGVKGLKLRLLSETNMAAGELRPGSPQAKRRKLNNGFDTSGETEEQNGSGGAIQVGQDAEAGSHNQRDLTLHQPSAAVSFEGLQALGAVLNTHYSHGGLGWSTDDAGAATIASLNEELDELRKSRATLAAKQEQLRKVLSSSKVAAKSRAEYEKTSEKLDKVAAKIEQLELELPKAKEMYRKVLNSSNMGRSSPQGVERATQQTSDVQVSKLQQEYFAQIQDLRQLQESRVKTLTEAYQEQLAAQKKSYEKTISTCMTNSVGWSSNPSSSSAQNLPNVEDLTKQLAALRIKLDATEVDLDSKKLQLETTEQKLDNVKSEVTKLNKAIKNKAIKISAQQNTINSLQDYVANIQTERDDAVEAARVARLQVTQDAAATKAIIKSLNLEAEVEKLTKEKETFKEKVKEDAKGVEKKFSKRLQRRDDYIIALQEEMKRRNPDLDFPLPADGRPHPGPRE